MLTSALEMFIFSLWGLTPEYFIPSFILYLQNYFKQILIESAPAFV